MTNIYLHNQLQKRKKYGPFTVLIKSDHSLFTVGVILYYKQYW